MAFIYHTKSDVPTRPTFVYVIACPGFAKIGVAGDPDRRRHNLQLTNPLVLHISSRKLFANLREAVAVERDLHGRFAEKRTWGEWFAIQAEMADAALAEFAEFIPEPVPEQKPKVWKAPKLSESEARIMRALEF